MTNTYHLAGSSAPPNIGQLKSVTSSAASTEYLSYSPLRQITCARDTIGGLDGYPTFNYDWYFNGAVKSIYYPSGRRVSYDVDDAGRTTKASAPGKTYMDLMEYAPDGRLTQSKLGNNIWETREFLPPGSPTTYRYGTSAGAGNVMELEYNYSGTGNNGNLLSQKTIRPGGAWQQTFTSKERDAETKLDCLRQIIPPGGISQSHRFI